MKIQLSKILILVFSFSFFTLLNAQTGKWTAVTTLAPHQNLGVCLLMTNGTVICHTANGPGDGTGWDRLTPDASGSYANGTWDTIASMHYDRLFFSTQVLPNGQVYAAGGEYGSGDTAGEIYNPLTNSWAPCYGVPSGWNIYDGNSELLYNGQILEGPQIGSATSYNILTLNPANREYTAQPNSIYNHDEAQWLKLPDSSVLFVGIATDYANRYIPQTGTWVTDDTLPGNLYDPYGEEAGNAHMLPNGKAIFFGATPYNAIYTPSGNPSPGKWSSADSFPIINGSYVGQPDASGAMMVNGHILLSVSPIGTSSNEFNIPCYFLEYDYVTNTFTQVKDTIPGMGGDSINGASYQTQMLDLPDGTVLLSISQAGGLSQQYFIYTPGSGPIPQGIPTINSIIADTCPIYKITGKLFNGIGDGAAYGDDWQMSTNYPIIRLTNGTNVYYATTSNWNRIGAVQTDSLEDTAFFTLPPSLPAGTYSLVVIANGFASKPTLFTTLGLSTSEMNIACFGGNGSATANPIGGISPYTYLWSPGGATSASINNLSSGTYSVTVTDNNGCSITAATTVTQPATAMVVAADSINSDNTGAGCTGEAWIVASGGAAPYTYLWTAGATTDTITGQCSGTYCCIVTDASGCQENVCVTIKATTGIENINNSNSISVYPDPSSGNFTVTGIEIGQVVEMYNYLGQIMESVSANNSTMHFNISNEADGIYLIRILNKDGSLVAQKKILKTE